MEKAVRLACIYQVVMHYRLPFYERLAKDVHYDFRLFYGRGQKGTKLVNADLTGFQLDGKQLWDVRVPLGNGFSMPFTPSLIWNLFRWRPDVVLCEGSSSLLNATQVFLYCKIFGAKFVWWSLGRLRGRKFVGWRRVVQFWEDFLARSADSVFTYSNLGKGYFLRQGVVEENIFVGVNVLDTDRKLEEINRFPCRITPELLKREINVAFIGSITPEKNLEVLIDAIRILNEKYPDTFALQVIGDGVHLQSLKKYACDMDDAVMFHGRINEGASSVLLCCQVMVLPGLGGLAISEGMLNRLPIITGYADGTELDLVGDCNGFVMEEISDVLLASKLEYLYNNPDLRLEMGRCSFERITGMFSFKEYYDQFALAVNHSMRSL